MKIAEKHTELYSEVTIKAHDSRYESFTEISKMLESKGVEVEVYERSESYETIESPILLYKTSSKENKYNSVQEAMVAGKKRSFEKCKENIPARLDAINEDLENLNESNPEFRTEVEKLNSILLQSINQARNEER